nr:hypothetical protein GCM10025699_71020 [Microbacterium flavescens]
MPSAEVYASSAAASSTPFSVSGVVIGTATDRRVGWKLSLGYQTTLLRACATWTPTESRRRTPSARAPHDHPSRAVRDAGMVMESTVTLSPAATAGTSTRAM